MARSGIGDSIHVRFLDKFFLQSSILQDLDCLANIFENKPKPIHATKTKFDVHNNTQQSEKYF